MPPAVFLSYRHVDAPFVRGLQVELERRLPEGAVIRDLQAFRGGDELRTIITAALEQATTVLVVIGPGWMDVDERTGRGRIHDGDDWVRFEVSLALAWNKVVVPVLIDQTKMPDRGQLPSDVAGLSGRVAHRVRDADWEADVAGLVGLICPGAGRRAEPSPEPPLTVDAGPIAGGNVTISGTNVAGRDLTVGAAGSPPAPPSQRRRRWGR